MRRILFLISNLGYGGTAKQLALLASNLPRDRFELCVAVLGLRGPLAESLEAAGVRVKALDWRRLFDLEPPLRLRRLVRDFQPDVIHTWGLPALRTLRIATGLTGQKNQLPRLVASRSLPPQPFRIGRLTRWLLCAADRIVASGPAEAFRYKQFAVPKAKIVLATPGVPIPTHHSLLPTHHSLLCVGPIERHKGFRDAIWGFDILRFLFDDLQLVIVGDGPDRPRLEGFVRAIQATDRVRFPGSLPDTAASLNQANVVWVPSLADGGRQVALEAMAAGRPVVASRLPGLAEVVVDGQTGFLVPPGDKVACAKQTRRLCDDPELAHRFGEAGRQHVRQHFSLSEMVRRYAELYDDLVHARQIDSLPKSA